MRVVEKFVSIDGEGPMAGELAVFIRFEGCNLRCSWCDTDYSWKSTDCEDLSIDEICEYIKQTGVHHVTLTGGEPLLHQDIDQLLERLSISQDLLIHIETNGSVAISEFKRKYAENIRYIVDYKLPASGMTNNMDIENLESVTSDDVYKFVIASQLDLEKTYEIVREYNLGSRCKVFLSPVMEHINPQEIVEFMKDKRLEGVKLQLQLHKFIWPKECRGV